MSRFACAAVVIALVLAPYLHAPANAAFAPGAARLDPVRVFNPAADSLLSAMFSAPKDLSPLALALFNEPGPAATALPSPLPSTPGGTAVIAEVNLHAYAPAAQLPGAPLERPSIMPVAPQPQRVQFLQAPVPQDAPGQGVHFGTYAPYRPPAQSVSQSVQVPVRVGGVHFTGSITGTQAQTTRVDAVRAMQLCGTTDEAAACPYLRDETSQSIAAGTDFSLRAGNTKVNLQLSGTVGRVNNRDALYQYAPLAPDVQFDAHAGTPQDDTLLYYPGITQVVRHGVDARLAVPVSPVISIGLQYDRSHYQGDYATIVAPGIDATKDTYLGNVTYQLPKSSSFVTLSARQFRYQDTFAPNFNLTETRADLSFTVKF